ncbi:HypC/HybG/HupF family hydrogenase formation chaperone [candidate division WOR-3 bacterium]|nr:HypC/HybG/HupF family hydrogenase formation chaperone [candidate division WOR-3 bacterium]
MCLGIPAQIVEIKEDGMALADIAGVSREIGIQLVPEVKVKNWVILHAGFAIQILDEKEAKETLKLLREISNYNPK